MRFRLLVLLSVMALVFTACSSAQQQAVSGGDDLGAPDAILLSYQLADGGSFVYDVSLEQNVKVSAEGSGAALEDENIPESADVNITGSGQFTFDVEDGADEGTYEVTITGEISDVSVSGTVDGETVSADEAPDFAAIEPISVTLLVDDKGNVIPSDPTVDDPFGGLFGGLDSLGSLGANSIPGANLGQFFGPQLSDEAVTVGDKWSASFDVPGFGAEPITTSVSSEVTASDSVDGAEVLVIDTTATTAAFEVNFADFFIGLFTGFLPDDASPEDQAQIDALVENLRFVLSSEETTANSTTYFDPELGVTRMFEVTSQSNLGFDINFPDEETGEMSGVVMDMTLNQKVAYKLVTGPDA
jgi:hypothetical protein